MINYYDYITSPEWYKRTEHIRLRDNGRCECCLLRYGDSVHHRTYINLGKEKDEDLLHICNCCHKMIHNIEVIGYFFIWPSRIPFLTHLRNEVLNHAKDSSTTRTDNCFN